MTDRLVSPGFEACEYCELHCPYVGYWHCPVCDAEWHDGNDDEEDSPNEQ